jgi:hypothetical protein
MPSPTLWSAHNSGSFHRPRSKRGPSQQAERFVAPEQIGAKSFSACLTDCLMPVELTDLDHRTRRRDHRHGRGGHDWWYAFEQRPFPRALRGPRFSPRKLVVPASTSNLGRSPFYQMISADGWGLIGTRPARNRTREGYHSTGLIVGMPHSFSANRPLDLTKDWKHVRIGGRPEPADDRLLRVAAPLVTFGPWARPWSPVAAFPARRAPTARRGRT